MPLVEMLRTGGARTVEGASVELGAGEGAHVIVDLGRREADGSRTMVAGHEGGRQRGRAGAHVEEVNG